MRKLAAVALAPLLAAVGGCADRGPERDAVRLAVSDSCPAPGTPLAFPSDGVLRDGPSIVRVCPAGSLPLTTIPPPLGSAGQALVELINGFDPNAQLSCTSDGGLTFALWFGYSDGQAQAVAVDQGGCGTVDAGGDLLVEESKDQVWSVFQRLSQQGG